MRMLLPMLLLACPLLCAQQADDVGKLIQKAGKEKKNVLFVVLAEKHQLSLALSGAIANENFTKYAAESFVMGRMELPASKEGATGDFKAKVTPFLVKYGVIQLPTIIVLDESGQCLAVCPYEHGDADDLIKGLDMILAAKAGRDRLLKEADEAEDDQEKARLLDEALSKIMGFGAVGYESIADKIIALDKDNKFGLKEAYLVPKLLQEVCSLLDAGKLAEAILKADHVLGKEHISGDARQVGLFYKGYAFIRLGDAKTARECLTQAILASPNSSLSKMISQTLSSIGAAQDEDLRE